MGDRTSERRLAEAVAVFAKDVGVWDIELTVTAAPGAASVLQRSTAENRIVGERWLISDHRGESGFAGHGIYGWDDEKRVYTGIWIDSVQSSMARSLGTWNALERTMTVVTEFSHQGKILRYREITQTVEDGLLLYRNLVPTPDGGEFEMIRGNYRRRGR